MSRREGRPDTAGVFLAVILLSLAIAILAVSAFMPEREMRKGRHFRRVLARVRVKKLAARHFKGKMTRK